MALRAEKEHRVISANQAHCKRIAFVTVPLSGHIRPAVSLAAAMADRGYAVDIIVDKTGINDDLLELQLKYSSLNLHGLVRGKELITKISWTDVACSTGRLVGSKIRLFEEVLRVANSDNLDVRIERVRETIGVLEQTQPDVVIVDHSQMIVREWAEFQGIPTVIMHTPYFLTGTPTGCARLDDEEQARLTEFFEHNNPMAAVLATRSALGLGHASEKKAIGAEEEEGAPATVEKLPEGAANAAPAEGLAPHTLVFCEPELLNEAHVPGRVHIVGPCFVNCTSFVDEHLLPWLDGAVALNERVLYVALGTLANGFLTPATIRILLRCFSTLTGAGGWRVLWSLPETQQRLVEEADMPANVRFEKFVRQRPVLAHPAVQVFLTHGGQSSVNEAIAAGVPLVCMPLFCDQYEMAEAVKRHGLGLVFHKDELLGGQDAKLLSMLQRAALEPMFLTMTKRHAALMKIRGGCGRAADIIESIVLVGADFEELWKGLPAVDLENVCSEDLLSNRVENGCSEEDDHSSLPCVSPSRRGGA